MNILKTGLLHKLICNCMTIKNLLHDFWEKQTYIMYTKIKVLQNI